MRKKFRLSTNFIVLSFFCVSLLVFSTCFQGTIHSLFLTNISVLNVLKGNLESSYQQSTDAKKNGYINSGQYYHQYMLDHQSSDLEKAFFLNPTNVGYIFLFADETIVKGDWVSSNQFFYSVPFARYLARRGMKLAYDGDPYLAKKGLYYLSFSRKILHDSQMSNFLGSVLCFKYGSYQKGEHLLMQAVQNNPRTPSYYASLSSVAANKGNINLRRSYQEIVRRLDKSNVWTLIDIGYSLLQENKIIESLAYFQKAKSIDHKIPYIYYSLANAYQKLDKQNLAEKEYIDALQINPIDAGPRYEWGMYLFNHKDFSRAVTQFTIALTLQADHVWSYYYRGLSYKEEGKIEKAKSDIEKCLRFEPENQTFKNRLDELHQLTKK